MENSRWLYFVLWIKLPLPVPQNTQALLCNGFCDTVDFESIEIGELVTLKASVNYVGKTSMVIGIRVDSENIQNGK